MLYSQHFIIPGNKKELFRLNLRSSFAFLSFTDSRRFALIKPFSKLFSSSLLIRTRVPWMPYESLEKEKARRKIYFQYQRVEFFIVKPFGRHWLGSAEKESHKYYSIGFEIQFTFTRTNDEPLLASLCRLPFLLHNDNNLLNPSTPFRADGIGAKTKQKKETSSVRRRATYWNQIVRKLSLNGTHDDALDSVQ